jgi:outer membrane protein OmpA-like peptidoglycan-associated protein
VLAGAALVLAAAPGCVTKKKFQSQASDTDQRITSVESALEDTDQRVDELAQTTDRKIASAAKQADAANSQAMSAAAAADKATKGKLIWTVNLTDDNVKFDFGKAVLSSSAVSSLDDLVGKIKSYGKALYLEIEGHADSLGEESYNAELARERADAVRNYLNANGGIPLHAMNTITWGESKPVADNSTNEGRAQNRRVVIRVLE